MRLLRTILFFVASATVLGYLFSKAVRRFEVEGRSMLPTYGPGDRVCVLPAVYRLRLPRIGDVVVVNQNANGNRRLDVKRITAGPGELVEVQGLRRVLGPDEWYVEGDNGDESTDSRVLGPVNSEAIVGPVWFRY